jgi:hypothetical protein
MHKNISMWCDNWEHDIVKLGFGNRDGIIVGLGTLTRHACISMAATPIAVATQIALFRILKSQ